MIYLALAERTAMQFITADEALRSQLVHLAWVVPPEQAVLDSRGSGR